MNLSTIDKIRASSQFIEVADSYRLMMTHELFSVFARESHALATALGVTMLDTSAALMLALEAMQEQGDLRDHPQITASRSLSYSLNESARRVYREFLDGKERYELGFEHGARLKLAYADLILEALAAFDSDLSLAELSYVIGEHCIAHNPYAQAAFDMLGDIEIIYRMGNTLRLSPLGSSLRANGGVKPIRVVETLS